MFEWLYPRDGDLLTRHDGVETEDALRITVRGIAPDNEPVTVNGLPARREGKLFFVELPLRARWTVLTAKTASAEHHITVGWIKRSRKRFRFSVDDNICFLKDLATRPETYPSLFEHGYLGFWREMHRAFGAKIHLNLYYQTDGFDLTQMPDRWKEEWRENAAWLHLSFHALQDQPDRPYRNARYAQIAHDFDLVTEHIRRFAGDAVLGNTTTIHWAECPADGVRALRDRGIENLVALFNVQGYTGECTTGYYLSTEQCARCDTRNAWHDPATDMNFIRCTTVVNAIPLNAVESCLDARTATPQTEDMLELLIHEQYFRRELHYFQPDVMDKVRTALRWAVNHGYEPVFWSEGFLGAQPSSQDAI